MWERVARRHVVTSQAVTIIKHSRLLRHDISPCICSAESRTFGQWTDAKYSAKADNRRDCCPAGRENNAKMDVRTDAWTTEERTDARTDTWMSGRLNARIDFMTDVRTDA